MKETKDKKKPEILFNFDMTVEEELHQTEFLYSYYIARLKLLRTPKTERYITNAQADSEVFYKDMIAACAAYMQSLRFKKKKDERNNKESGELP